MTIHHTSVLLEEAVQALNPRHGKIYVDGTLGGGGHSARLSDFLDSSNVLIGIDQDPVALEEAKKRLSGRVDRLHIVSGNFGDIYRILLELGYPQIEGGVLLDLGVSEFQLRSAERGFSFQQSAPLDMRMNPELPTTAEMLVNSLPAKALADIFYNYADEKLSRQIAEDILAERPIDDTLQLARIAESVYRKKGVKLRNIHPATRIFQALRIAVNREIEMLEQFLEQLPEITSPGVRVAIISFHSGEDRFVKQFFRQACANCICSPRQPVCTCNHKPMFKQVGKSIKPSSEEVKLNPQARSAKLRVFERI